MRGYEGSQVMVVHGAFKSECTALRQLGYNFYMPNYRRPDLDWRVIHAGA
jgi:hypothetical protein